MYLYVAVYLYVAYHKGYMNCVLSLWIWAESSLFSLKPHSPKILVHVDLHVNNSCYIHVCVKNTLLWNVIQINQWITTKYDGFLQALFIMIQQSVEDIICNVSYPPNSLTPPFTQNREFHFALIPVQCIMWVTLKVFGLYHYAISSWSWLEVTSLHSKDTHSYSGYGQTLLLLYLLNEIPKSVGTSGNHQWDHKGFVGGGGKYIVSTGLVLTHAVICTVHVVHKTKLHMCTVHVTCQVKVCLSSTGIANLSDYFHLFLLKC